MLQASRRNSASAEIHCGRPSQCVKNLLPLTPSIAILFFCFSLFLFFSSIALPLRDDIPKKAAVLLDFVQITSSKKDSPKYLIVYFNRPIRPDPTWPPTQYFFFNIRPDLILKIPSPWALVVRPFCQASNGKCDISLRSALLCLQRLNWNLRPNHGKQPFRTFPTSNWKLG